MADVSVEGVEMAASAAEAANGADLVITMLPNGAILRGVADQIIPAMKRGAAFVDCSTVDVDSARAVAEQAEAAGLLPVDAPVSGGVGGASAGTLTFMAGGSDAAFARAEPLFDIMGQKAVHCGDSGAGQAAKICNNMILGVTMIATCEAFALADKLGPGPAEDVRCGIHLVRILLEHERLLPGPRRRPAKPGGQRLQTRICRRSDAEGSAPCSQQAAASADADTPMGALAQELYARFVEHEDGAGRDFSAMLPRFEKRHRGG